MRVWRDGTEDKVLILHMTNLGLISGILFGPLGHARSNFQAYNLVKAPSFTGHGQKEEPKDSLSLTFSVSLFLSPSLSHTC